MDLRARSLLLGLSCLGALAACNSKSAVTPATERCCDDGRGNRVTRMDSCLAGEIALPMDRCMVTPDAGINTCGDGVWDDTIERCDLSAADGNTCTGVETCTASCACEDQCGNGVVNAGETCEATSDCDMTQRCRRCSCVLASIPVELPDPSGDLAAGNETRRWLDITKVSIALLDSGQAWNITLSTSIASTMIEARHCAIFTDAAGAEVWRYCAVSDTRTTTAFLSEMGGPERDVSMDTMFRGTSNLSFLVPTNLAPPNDKALGLHVSATLDGVEVDRVPDSGTYPWADVIGR